MSVVDAYGSTDRREFALGVVAAAERAAKLHRVPVPHGFDLHDHVARRVGAHLDALPAAVRPAEDASNSRRVRSTSRAALILFGKFDRDGSIRARAYVLSARPTSLKVQTHRQGARHGIDREVRARREVDQLLPGLAPRMHGTGSLPRHGVSWIAEEIVHGTHPAGPREVNAAADAVIGAVARLYAASGYTSAPRSEVLAAQTLERFEATLRSVPALGRFLSHVRRLFADDRMLELAFAHGDLVGSNVLVRDDGSVQLLDWEFAARRPVVDDLGTVLTQAHDKHAAIAVIERHLGERVGTRPSSYGLHDQLILAQVRMLSWHDHRRQRAERAGRLAPFDRDTERRIRSLDALTG